MTARGQSTMKSGIEEKIIIKPKEWKKVQRKTYNQIVKEKNQ